MTYKIQTTTTNLQSFLTDLMSFATTYAGFTAITTFTHEATKTAHVIKKGDIYWNFYEGIVPTSGLGDLNGVFLRMTTVPPTTFAEILTVDGQFRMSFMSVWLNHDGPYIGYHFYTEGDNVHAVLEVYDNVFNHVSFGNIEKTGTWVGGEYVASGAVTQTSGGEFVTENNTGNNMYFDGGQSVLSPFSFQGSYYPSQVRYIPGALTGGEADFAPVGRNTQNDQLARFVNGGQGLLRKLVNELSPLSYNLRSPAFPIYLRLYNPVKEDLVLSGTVPNVRHLNVSGIVPKSIVEVDWRVFPSTQITGGANTALAPYSNYGFIYKEILPDVS